VLVFYSLLNWKMYGETMKCKVCHTVGYKHYYKTAGKAWRTLLSKVILLVCEQWHRVKESKRIVSFWCHMPKEGKWVIDFWCHMPTENGKSKLLVGDVTYRRNRRKYVTGCDVICLRNKQHSSATLISSFCDVNHQFHKSCVINVTFKSWQVCTTTVKVGERTQFMRSGSVSNTCIVNNG